MKTKICFFLLIIAVIAIQAAQAGTKEEVIRLQSEVKLLQGQVQEFIEDYKERLSVIHSLMNQLIDENAKSNSILLRLGSTLSNQTSDARNQDSSVRTDIRDLTERINDISIGISVMAQQLNDYKVQNAMMAETAAGGISPDIMFNQAMRDFIREDFDMAIEGFTAFAETYPGGETAAKAWLYIGDSHGFQHRLVEAVDAFTRVINDYTQTQVVPTALYKRANVEIAMQERDNAIADLRDIIERFPDASEAGLAKTELQRLDAGAVKPKTVAKPTTPSRKTTTR